MTMSFLKFSILALFFWAAAPCSTFAQTANNDQGAQNLATTTLKVKGVTCGMDLKSIAANVEKVTGVSTCKPGKQGPTTTFEIRYDPALASEKAIHAAIENTAGCQNPNDRPYKVKQ
jgi:copper chaperone CopZ